MLSGAEPDLFRRADGKNHVAEFKYSDAPLITKSMRAVVEDPGLERPCVAYPGAKGYALSERIEVVMLEGMMGRGCPCFVAPLLGIRDKRQTINSTHPIRLHGTGLRFHRD